MIALDVEHAQTSTLESVFENLRFHSPKTPFTCGRNAETEEKTSVFKNIRIRVDGAQDASNQMLIIIYQESKLIHSSI